MQGLGLRARARAVELYLAASTLLLLHFVQCLSQQIESLETLP